MTTTDHTKEDDDEVSQLKAEIDRLKANESSLRDELQQKDSELKFMRKESIRKSSATQYSSFAMNMSGQITTNDDTEGAEAEAEKPEPVDVTMEPDEQQLEQVDGKSGFMKQATSKALRPFVIISSSYLLFTITDGAIRMIVLLHAYNKSFSAMEVAIMFTLYELAGVFTNLVS